MVMSYVSGLLTMFSLIVALGAQNVFVLRQGIRRQYTTVVILMCIVSDTVLVAVGVAGLGGIINDVPWLMTAARWGGALFLLTYAAFAARRALHPSAEGLVVSRESESGGGSHTGSEVGAVSAVGEEVGAHGGAPTQYGTVAPAEGTVKALPTWGARQHSPRARALAAIVLQTLAFTWLNPGVYLDTVVLVGSLAATYGDARWVFAGGAMTASLVWFLALGYGARHLGRWLRTPRAWQVLDVGIAVVLVLMAVLLVTG